MVFVVLLIGFKYADSYKNNPISGQNVNYKELVNSLILNKYIKDRCLIVFFDASNSFRYIPLSEYYFKGFNQTDKLSVMLVKKYFKNKKIELLKNLRGINSLEIKDKETVVFIIFDWDNKKYTELKNTVNAYEQTGQIKTTNIFYRLECQDSNCSFYKSK